MNYVLWAALGALAAAAFWFVYTPAGAIGVFVVIGAAFVLWRMIGRRGAWLCVAVLSATMTGLIGWQAVTGARCPDEGTSVVLKEGKPPVSCDDVRASSTVMAIFFLLLTGASLYAPRYARSLPPRDDEPPTDTQVPE